MCGEEEEEKKEVVVPALRTVMEDRIHSLTMYADQSATLSDPVEMFLYYGSMSLSIKCPLSFSVVEGIAATRDYLLLFPKYGNPTMETNEDGDHTDLYHSIPFSLFFRALLA